MISLFSLWLPILLSAIGVFAVSSIIHMALSYHQSDWQKLPAEEEIADSLRKHALPPGNYIIPHGEGMKAMSDPEFLARMERGGFPAIQYQWYKNWYDPRSGIVTWTANPRFCTGYAALQNRPAVSLSQNLKSGM